MKKMIFTTTELLNIISIHFSQVENLIEELKITTLPVLIENEEICSDFIQITTKEETYSELIKYKIECITDNYFEMGKDIYVELIDLIGLIEACTNSKLSGIYDLYEANISGAFELYVSFDIE